MDKRCLSAVREQAIRDAEEGEPVDVMRILLGHEEFGSWILADGFDADGDDLEVEARTEIRGSAEWGVQVLVEREMPHDVVARLLRKAADLFDGPQAAQLDELTSGDSERGYAHGLPDGSLWVGKNFLEFCGDTAAGKHANDVAAV